MKLKECYEKFIENTEGSDPDFPMANFGGKGKKIAGKENINNNVEEKPIDKL